MLCEYVGPRIALSQGLTPHALFIFFVERTSYGRRPLAREGGIIKSGLHVRL